MKSLGVGISRRGLIQNTFARLQSTAPSPEIRIPANKERGPTDILQALEKTISRDPTGAKYKYHDDPYLIPYSNMQKRAFALAQESGRKTAMFIRQEHADLFQHRIADPVIEAFLPKAVYADKAAVSEDTLRSAIANGHKSDAITIYHLLDEQVSDETKQSLLELLCYYNNDEKFSDELLEEKWFRRVERSQTWKHCSVTDKLFAILKEKDAVTAAKAYNAMICGLAKFLKVHQAWDLYQEALNKDYALSIDSYNQLIGVISYMKDGTRERMALLMEIYRKISDAGLTPNTTTRTQSLKLAAAIPKHSSAMEICRDIFTEFNGIGIKPSLTCYYYALLVFYKKAEASAPPNALIREIILELEAREELIMQNTLDTSFFTTAMDITANHLEDPILANRIHKLLLTNDNHKFIGDGFKESLYYRNYLRLQNVSNSLDVFMKSYYDLIVPHMYTPEPNVMSEILQAVSANDPEMGLPLLPRLWTHLVQFNYLERKDLVSKALNLMTTHCVPPKNSPIHNMYADAAWTVWDFVMTQKTKRLQQINWTGPILGDVAVLCLRANEFEKWTTILSFLNTNYNTIVGPLSSAQIDELFEACLIGGNTSSALDLLQYCTEIGLDSVSSMAYKIYKTLPLSSQHMTRLKSLADPEVFKIASSISEQ